MLKEEGIFKPGRINRRLVRPVLAGSAAGLALFLSGVSPAWPAEGQSRSKSSAAVKTVAGAIARIQGRVRHRTPLSFADQDNIPVATRNNTAGASLAFTCLQKPVKMPVSGKMHWFVLEQMNNKKPRLTTIKARPLGPADAVAEQPILNNVPTIRGTVRLDPEGQPVVPLREGTTTSDLYVAYTAPCNELDQSFGFSQQMILPAVPAA